MAGSAFSNLTQNLGESIQIELVICGLISHLETGTSTKGRTFYSSRCDGLLT